jgi:hypothetical protein
MPVSLRPGDLTTDPIDYTEFADSMAETIELELDRLLGLDGLPALPKSASDREVRDRRRLFVAIARSVVLHLVARNEAFDVTPTNGDTVHPVIRNEQD